MENTIRNTICNDECIYRILSHGDGLLSIKGFDVLAKKLFQFHLNFVVDQAKKYCHYHSLKLNSSSWIPERFFFFSKTLTWKEMVNAEITSIANFVLPSLSGLNAATKWCKPNKGTKRAENSRNFFSYFAWGNWLWKSTDSTEDLIPNFWNTILVAWRSTTKKIGFTLYLSLLQFWPMKLYLRYLHGIWIPKRIQSSIGKISWQILTKYRVTCTSNCNEGLRTNNDWKKKVNS